MHRPRWLLSRITSEGSSRAMRGLEPQRQACVAAAVEVRHGVADRGQHPLDPVLATFVERELDPPGAKSTRAGAVARRRALRRRGR
jgi:hypothetical protein